jgi:hypothetical protein
MRSSILLRLADAGVFPRRVESIIRERRFATFWEELAELEASASYQERAAAQAALEPSQQARSSRSA